MVMVEVVGLFRESSRGVAALPVRVDGPVVVGSRSVLAAVVGSPAEEQTSFVAVIPAVAASASGGDGVAAARVTTPLLPAASGQENSNKCHNQKQRQEGSDDGAGHNASTGWILQGFCRGDGGVGRRDGKNGWRERKKRAGSDGCAMGSLAQFFWCESVLW